ncbi:MAG: hypothetical protein ACRCR1_06365 [Aeromonas sp.]
MSLQPDPMMAQGAWLTDSDFIKTHVELTLADIQARAMGRGL